MISHHKVSIIIPVYNGSNYLAQAIDSALAQTYKNIEILVVNDGSSDNGQTESIALSYGNKIRYFFKKNGGVSTALNLGIREMTGEYFSWLSHDDLYYPEKIEKQIDLLKKENFASNLIIYSDSEKIDENQKVIQKFICKEIEPRVFRLEIMKGNGVDGCSLLIPKHCFYEVGFFNEKLRTTQDYSLWFEFSYKYTFVHLPEIIVKSREHKSRTTYKRIDSHLKESNAMFISFMKKISESELENYCLDKRNNFIKDSVTFLTSHKLFDSAIFCLYYYKPKNKFFFIKKQIMFCKCYLLWIWFMMKRSLRKLFQ
ncbi:MAG: glycosyl transferase family 2 [uncultured bacterium]|nr:MAG: glycosyl transferase family 2 [uncultured bacterium]